MLLDLLDKRGTVSDKVSKSSKVFGFRISSALQEALKKYAASIGVSESDVARMALIEFLRQKGVVQ